MAKLDHDREQCARMLMKGASPAEISGRLGKPLNAVEDIMKEAAVVQRYQELMTEKLDSGLYDDETVFTDEQLNAVVDGLTKPAIRALREVLEDPRASAAAKVKAAEMSLSWQKTIQARTKKQANEEERLIQPIYMDKKAVEALERIADEFAGDDWQDRLAAELNRMPVPRI